MIRAAVIFTNYGPYHVARARALTKIEDIEPVFIELGSEDRGIPWEPDRKAISDSLVTLVDGAYDESPTSILVRRLLDTLDDVSPDAVATSNYGLAPMRAAARWAKAHGKVSVLMSTTTGLDRDRVWWRELWKRWWIPRHFDAALTVGTASRGYLTKLGMEPDRVWVGHNVVDNEYFASEAKEARSRMKEVRGMLGLPDRFFLFVGRLSPEKNLVRLLQAYRQYADGESQPWGLVLVGGGPEGEALTAVANDLALEEVVWAGFKQLGELPPYYALASGFVLPSVSESWGLVVNEAMASGLPVLVSNRCGCATDLVEEGKNGYSFNPYDISEIKERLSMLASLEGSERESMCLKSQEIIADYRLETWAQKLADCINVTTALRYERGSYIRG